VSSYGVYSRNKDRIDRAVFSPRSHRGVSAPSFRDGVIRFSICLEKQGSHRGHREHREKIEENSWGQLLSWRVLGFWNVIAV